MEDKKNEHVNIDPNTDLLDSVDSIPDDQSSETEQEDNITAESDLDQADINFVLVDESKTDKTVPLKEKVLTEEDFENKLHQNAYLKSKPVHHDDESILINKKSFSRFIAAVLIIAIIGGFTVGVGYRTADYFIFNNVPESSIRYVPEFDQISHDTLDLGDYSITNIANKVEPSVVAITNEVVQNSIFGQQSGTSAGSGVIFDVSTEKIYILTNHHVIDASSELSVSFFGESNYPATIIGSDPNTDLAVITVERSELDEEIFNRIRSIEIGNSDNLLVGEPAIAVGNPLGYNNTVTVGIISALDRFISEDLNSLSLIQTDAAINPGNSGGALVNSRGELIGINTIKISATDVEGIGFAIPINSAIPVLDELIEKGYISQPFIGIYGKTITKEESEFYKVPVGVAISETVPNGPAAKYGLEKYDIITKLDDIEITTMEELTSELMKYHVGDIVEIEVQREVSEGSSNTPARFESHIISLRIGDRNKY
ncbi:MAG: trypsin-like peptidase domain-containing protein [Clostridiales bacterium]|nr:trypsin-like peptidase domain-containing protein [Clostridiales bacterium]